MSSVAILMLLIVGYLFCHIAANRSAKLNGYSIVKANVNLGRIHSYQYEVIFGCRAQNCFEGASQGVVWALASLKMSVR